MNKNNRKKLKNMKARRLESLKELNSWKTGSYFLQNSIKNKQRHYDIEFSNYKWHQMIKKEQNKQ